MFTFSDGTCETDSGIIRRNYRYTHVRINTPQDLAATLRNGQYAWPGGYPMFFITSDGAALSFKAVAGEFRNCVDSIKHNTSGGWKVEAVEINYEDQDLTCEHLGTPIESAYGDRNPKQDIYGRNNEYQTDDFVTYGNLHDLD